MEAAKRSGKLTPKRKKFARAVVSTGEYTKAYRAAFDTSDMQLSTIHEEASRTASIPQVRAEIERLLQRSGTDVDEILAIHRRNMLQENHLPTSQRAAESFEEMLGLKQAAAAPTVNVAFVINRESKDGVGVRKTDGGVSNVGGMVVTAKDNKIIDPPDPDESVL